MSMEIKKKSQYNLIEKQISGTQKISYNSSNNLFFSIFDPTLQNSLRSRIMNIGV